MEKIVFYTAIILLIVSCGVKKESLELSATDRILFEKASVNADQANEGYIRCNNYVNAWLEYADPFSGLIPRNIESSKDFWNAKDAAADNYPFMVLTSFFVDDNLFAGKMREMLDSERRLTSRVNSLPDTYSFSKGAFLDDQINMGSIVFGSSEYIKDGLLPLTEWLGQSPWSDRMTEMIYDLNKEVIVAGEIGEKGYGNATKDEVNGELLQVLSRLYWMTGDEKLLDWAVSIGDFYLLGDNHPTRDFSYLRLRDHGCELISGLCELYITLSFVRPEKKSNYQEPIHEILNRILEVGRNEDGFFYDAVNPQSGEIVEARISDTWGYTLNGFYGVYIIDKNPEYKEAVLKVFSNLDKYKNFDWEDGSSDGYADAIESALNLYNRMPDPKVAKWIDSEILVMWGKQKESGIIEGWHGDGNFARTTIMYNLWKSKGVYAKPWRKDLFLGGEQKGDSLFISLKSDSPWSGKLFFDKARHKDNMHLPIDWPRINQFPEWFVTKKEQSYHFIDINEDSEIILTGDDLQEGLEMHIDNGNMLIIY